MFTSLYSSSRDPITMLCSSAVYTPDGTVWFCMTYTATNGVCVCVCVCVRLFILLSVAYSPHYGPNLPPFVSCICHSSSRSSSADRFEVTCWFSMIVTSSKMTNRKNLSASSIFGQQVARQTGFPAAAFVLSLGACPAVWLNACVGVCLC